jgi:hypothetical protein
VQTIEAPSAHPLHGEAVRVSDPEPVPRRSGFVGRGNNALQSHRAGPPEHQLALASVCSLSAIPPCSRASSRATILALAERQRPVVDPIEFQQVEGLQDGTADTAATVQGVATGNDCAVMVLTPNGPLSLSMSRDGTERAGMARR